MNRKKKIICIILLFVVLVSIIGFTFAYIGTRILGNSNSKKMSFTSKKVSVTYKEISNTSSGETISPGYEYLKIFTATNTGNVEVKYHIYLDEVENNFIRVQDITYTLYRKSGNNTITSSNLSSAEVIASGTFPIINQYIKTDEVLTKPNDVYTYALKINYNTSTESQDSDSGHVFGFKVQLHSEIVNPYSSDTTLLAYNIINNAVIGATGTTLASVPETNVAVDISGADETILSVAQDDLGTSYYYRGNVQDNYLEFNGYCWRIVRIEGDGSIKITLAAIKTCSSITSSDTETAFIGTGNYGYTKGKVTNSSGQQSTNDKYVADYLNSSNNTSSMKYKLEAWLTSSGIDTNKLKEDSWCLGNTTDPYDNSGALLTSIVNDLMYNGTEFYYDTYVRLYGKGQTANATLRCDGKNYKTHKSYIGALTADEVVYAGGKATTRNSNYYLTANASNWWRTISSANFSGDFSRAFRIGGDGIVYDGPVNSSSLNLRPAVSLASGAKISNGDGSISNPYTIQ